jgi:hypothetical protein
VPHDNLFSPRKHTPNEQNTNQCPQKYIIHQIAQKNPIGLITLPFCRTLDVAFACGVERGKAATSGLQAQLGFGGTPSLMGNMGGNGSTH